MKTKALMAAVAAAGIAVPVAAQPVKPIYDPPSRPAYEEPQEYSDRSDEFREAFRRGYERGFERGYERGLAEGERRAGNAVPLPPPPPPAPRIGPIRVTGAYYGTSSQNCDATRWLGRLANGKRSYSVEVTNDICGDPAHGQRKSLEVTYRCGDIEKTASANEHRTIYLSCAP